jgi:predicted small lipoprotein YifL
MRFADWLYARTGKTHEIALERLARLIQDFLTTELAVDSAFAAATLQRDYEASGAKGRLEFPDKAVAASGPTTKRRYLRQARHIMN